MRIKFDPNQQYQKDAVNAVVDIFDGQPLNASDFEISFTHASGLKELGFGNNLSIDNENIFENVQNIQTNNSIDKVSLLQEMHFSIEMETGTGKTYVFLRTIFELNKKYGLRKYVIVVPSVAIREGTLKNLEITKEHFKTIYNNVSFDYFVYDSKRVSEVRQFASSNQIQIMVINIDAFRKTLEDKDDEKKSNVIHRESDKLSGRKPIEFVQATRPIVIIDEPQSVDNTPKAQEAIATLNPLCTLRYSATHRNPYNLLYKLDPIRAYDMRLVKRIEVASVVSGENFNQAYIKLIGIDNRNGLKAKIAIHVDTPSGPKEKKITVKKGDDLFHRSKEREMYRDGYVVDEICAEPDNEYISFNSGNLLRLDETQGGLTDEVMKSQIRNAIQEHLEKEIRLKGKSIKVLTLFFIDKVANYRSYDDAGNPVKGKIAIWFEEAFQELIQNKRYTNLSPFELDKLHDGYFAVDKKGKLKDTKGDSQADEDVYNKIMKNKEQLLSLDEPLRFIFSHSALREGWDNPNVFQICTLNETKSDIKKRQEIGRGLRLPVNNNGERIFDESINRLTIIANESYEDFAKTLQTEIEDDFNIKFGVIGKGAFAKIIRIIDDKEVELGQTKSEQIWEELKNEGFLDDEGKIQPKFNPSDRYFELTVNDEFKDIKHQIIDTVQSYIFSNRIVDKSKQKKVRINKQVFLDKDFAELWNRIKHKTTYSVEFDTNIMIKKVTASIRCMPKVEPTKIQYRKAQIDIEEKGITAKEVRVKDEDLQPQEIRLPDILAYLQKETELTRSTLARILIESGRIEEFAINPQRFMDAVVSIIKKELHKLMIDGIQYEKIAGEEYEMRLFEDEIEVLRYLNNLVEVQHSVHNVIPYDSDVEKTFALELDVRNDIKLFTKLPRDFIVDTPVGHYNPDWAIVKNGDAKLYLVRETKGTTDDYKLRASEADKMRCATKHFDELGIDYNVVTSAREV